MHGHLYLKRRTDREKLGTYKPGQYQPSEEDFKSVFLKKKKKDIGQTVTAVNSMTIPVLFDPINYAQHTVRIQYRTRNPYKQASVSIRNLENC